MSDPWADWLLLRRFAGSEEVRREFMEHLTQVREKVLDNAEIASGEVLLDVGCGDGLIGVAGLDAARPHRRVLRHLRGAAQ